MGPLASDSAAAIVGIGEGVAKKAAMDTILQEFDDMEAAQVLNLMHDFSTQPHKGLQNTVPQIGRI